MKNLTRGNKGGVDYSTSPPKKVNKKEKYATPP